MADKKAPETALTLISGTTVVEGKVQTEGSIRIDGKLVYSGQLSGTMKRRLPFFEKAVATSAQTLALSAGDHLVEVHVQSPDGDYDQTRSCSVNLPSGQQGTLVVNSLRGGLSLAYQGVPAAPSGAPGSDYSGYLRSILVTVLGSAVSAAIGFAVQEALRARKATASVQNPAGKDVS